MTTSSTDQTSPHQQPLNETPAPSNPKEGSQVEVVIRHVEFDIYFDGTWNSKFNSNWYNNSDWSQLDNYIETNDRYSYIRDSSEEEKIKVIFKADETSFARAPTGVDRMNRSSITSNPYIIPLYVDGAGTETPSDDPYSLDDVNQYVPKGPEVMQSDSAIGSGLGRGDTGVYAKLEKMFEQVQNKLNLLTKDSKRPIHIIIFNVYGFSRGAATARMFVHRIVKEQKSPDVKKWLDLTNYAVMVKFVGLFDTVSSIGLDHTNDVEGDKQGLEMNQQEGLHNHTNTLTGDSLDFAEGKITGKIVHLVAGHEFRQKFSVTSIKQAVQRGYGFEVVLPGNHTDIGDGKGTSKTYDSATKQWVLTNKSVDEKTILQKKSWSFGDLGSGATKLLAGAISPVVRDQKDMEKASNDASLEQVKQILINQGWFINSGAQKQIWIKKDDSYEMLNVKRELSRDYPKVPTWIMIALMKEMGAYHLNKKLIEKYMLENTQDPTLEAIYNDLHTQVMTRWRNESTDYIAGSIVNNSQHQLPYVTVRNIDLEKQMFNRYLQWSTSVGQGFGDAVASVSIGRIDPKTHQFYRAIING